MQLKIILKNQVIFEVNDQSLDIVNSIMEFEKFL